VSVAKWEQKIGEVDYRQKSKGSGRDYVKRSIVSMKKAIMAMGRVE
jgi:hypothetical protein